MNYQAIGWVSKKRLQPTISSLIQSVVILSFHTRRRYSFFLNTSTNNVNSWFHFTKRIYKCWYSLLLIKYILCRPLYWALLSLIIIVWGSCWPQKVARPDLSCRSRAQPARWILAPRATFPANRSRWWNHPRLHPVLLTSQVTRPPPISARKQWLALLAMSITGLSASRKKRLWRRVHRPAHNLELTWRL